MALERNKVSAYYITKMSQTLQNQLLLAKSMNGIISFDDGAGTTISNGQVITNGVNADNVDVDTITTNTLTVPSLSLTDLTVNGTGNIRSSWATGGVENMGLYRNIGQILTPFVYNPTARFISLNDEITGLQWVIDFSNNTMISALDINNFYYNVFVGRDLTVTTGTTTLKNTICFSGDMDVPSNLSLVTTTSIGPNTLSVCQPTAYADNITAIGSGVLQVAANTHTGTTAIGAQAFGQATNLGNNNTAIGYRAGYNITSGNVTNCTFIGNNTGVANPTATISNSLVIGNGAIITNSNTVNLGGLGLLVVVPSNLQIQSKFVERGSGTLFSAAFSMTVVPFTYYSINSVTPFSITLQAPIGTYLGTRCTFRRVSGDPNNAITSASANIYRFDSNTPTNELLPPGIYSCTICCMLISGTTYGWFQIETNETTGVDLTTNQTVAGIKTFSSPPVMSGASISSATIGQTQITDGYLNLTGSATQTITTRKEFTTGGLVMRNPYPLVGNMNTPTNLSTILCVSIGNSNLAACPTTAGQTAITAIGGGVFQALSSAGAGLVGIGNGALGQATSLGNFNTAIGYRAGYNQTTGASVNCSFLGAETAVSSATTLYTKSTAVGHGSTISASNQVVLGTATETVFVPGLLQVDNNYVAGASPTLITSNTTLSGPVYQFYSVSLNAGNITITLPAASADYLGCSITFRRVGSNSSNQIFSASSNLYQHNAFSTTNIIMTFDIYRSTITCMLLDATPSYAWFQYIFL